MTLKSLLAAAVVAPGLLGVSATVYAAGSGDPLAAFTYKDTALVSDLPGAVTTDPNLVDPWGIAFAPTGAFWVNDRGTGVATLYSGAGAKVNMTFTIPPPAGQKIASNPTGLVANLTKAFLVPGTQLPAAFIFSSLDGTISAWAPNLPSNPTDAVLAVDNSKSHAVYTGLDFGINAKGGFLYAANVATASIDVFDSTFKAANSELTGKFQDPAIPPGYTPFNVHNVDGDLVVTYALQNAGKTFITPAPGAGFVDVFDTNGNLLRHIAAGGPLNAPWGVARAPSGFGGLSGDLLIGNFGDGHIFGFHGGNGPIHVLLGTNDQPIVIPGLWTLTFGGGSDSNPDTLFFSAGIDGGQHGLFGSFTPASTTP